MNSVLEPIINGFMLGVTAGPVCFSGCFPMLLSITIAEGKEKTSQQAWLFIGKFLTGRLLAYLVFGLFVIYVGSRLGGLIHQIGIYAWIVLSILLIAYGLGLPMPHLGLCSLIYRTPGSRFFPFILGGLTAMNLCPPFLLAITYALQNNVGPSSSISFFMAFFTATSLFIAPAGIAGFIPYRKQIALCGRVATVIVGAIFFYEGMTALMNWSG
jgi:hypothetical protein